MQHIGYSKNKGSAISLIAVASKTNYLLSSKQAVHLLPGNLIQIKAL